MASRGNSSTGANVTIAILAVVAFGMLVFGLIYFGKANQAKSELAQLKADTSDFVSDGERSSDDVRRLVSVKPRNQSLVGYLKGASEELARSVTGNARDGLDQVKEKIAAVPGAAGQSLLATIGARDSTIRNLETRVAQAERAREAANTDLVNERRRVSEIQSEFEQQVAALEEQVGRLSQDADYYRERLGGIEQQMAQRVAESQSSASEIETTLTSRIAELNEQKLILENQLAELRGQNGAQQFRVTDEFALVDGEVSALSPADNLVYISLGRKDKARVGMTFGVYNNASQIRPDAQGNYAAPKASLEVVNVGENSSTCRVLFQTRGNPVVKGDVIANPVFDPKKVYRVVVFGNFDANHDGQYTPLERDDIVARVREWGAEVADDVTGDLDFLILGRRPVLPPKPAATAPVEVIREYIRLESLARQYDDFFQRATATSIPVINENRLYTLLGGR
ncbi:MAG: hypothetical protein RBS39_12805 [Phycisphaerales bacterium]|jgi:hypothetical protein|nr:hypothetical protein [Phycisphaerales bacterium]